MEESLPVKRKKASKERNPSKKLKPKKRSKKLEGKDFDASWNARVLSFGEIHKSG